MDRDQDSEYNFVIDRFLADEPGSDVLQDDVDDDEQPILFTNCSMRGRKLPPFRSLNLPVKAMAMHGIETASLAKSRTGRVVSRLRKYIIV